MTNLEPSSIHPSPSTAANDSDSSMLSIAASPNVQQLEPLDRCFSGKPFSPFRNFDLNARHHAHHQGAQRRSSSPQLLNVVSSVFSDYGSQEMPPLLRTASGQTLGGPSPVATTDPTTTAINNARSGSARVPVNTNRYIPSALLALPATTDAMDPEVNMRMMDRLYNASFAEFIRSEENLLTIARHMMAIVKDYNLQTLANGLRWLVNGWRMENIAKLLKILTRDWLPDVCGVLVNLITLGWTIQVTELGGENKIFRAYFKESMASAAPKVLAGPAKSDEAVDRLQQNSTFKLIAILAAGETADVTATFIKSLTATENWTSEKVTELVSFMDTVLDWDEGFFRSFTEHYVKLSKAEQNAAEKCSGCATDDEDESLEKMVECTPANKTRSKSGKLALDYLAALYKTNLALASYKLALADFKLALAARNLNGGGSNIDENSHRSSLSEASASEPQNQTTILSPLELFRAYVNQRQSQEDIRRISSGSNESAEQLSMTTALMSTLMAQHRQNEMQPEGTDGNDRGYIRVQWQTQDANDEDSADEVIISQESNLYGSTDDFWRDVITAQESEAEMQNTNNAVE